MKKLISRRNFLKVCALAGSAAALSACGGGKSTGGSNSAAAAVDTTGAVEFPLSEKVTFTGMTSFPVGSESEPNNRTIFKRLEEQTNVHIDWTAIQSDQWNDKITDVYKRQEAERLRSAVGLPDPHPAGIPAQPYREQEDQAEGAAGAVYAQDVYKRQGLRCRNPPPHSRHRCGDGASAAGASGADRSASAP